jgi:UDP-N-acetylmuramoyl-tripeptide--D-alanyl-D-alanine ligase
MPVSKVDAMSPSFTSNFIAEALNLSSSTSSVVFTQICTDSRKIVPGCLFVALKGEKFDAHEFIDSAVEAGAAGVVCKRGFEPKVLMSGGKPLLLYKVDDTLVAFRKIAQAWRKQFSLPVVVVAGSMGKTTTKELLAAALSGKYSSVLKTKGSLNGFVGIPLTLMELNSSHQAAVIEVGIDDIGAMEQHMAIVHGTAAMLTAIGAEHLEKLKDLPSVAREEGVALTWVAKQNGTVVINLDDPWIKPHWSTIRDGKKAAFTTDPSHSSKSDSNIFYGEISSDLKSIRIKDETYPLPLPGAHNAKNALGAIAMSLALGLSPNEIKKGLKDFVGPEGRSQITKINNITVICDYYNANPSSMEASFKLLADFRQSKTRWACLGDMLELGADEILLHTQLSQSLIALGIEKILLYGPRMKALYNEMAQPAFTGSVQHFETYEELANVVATEAKSGDTILVKGSRGMKMENIVELLKQKWRKS